MWTTLIMWKDGQNWVRLSRDGVLVAELTLDDWAGLAATDYVVTEALGTDPAQRDRPSPSRHQG
jgi:hypothetical protein